MFKKAVLVKEHYWHHKLLNENNRNLIFIISSYLKLIYLKAKLSINRIISKETIYVF
jgi:hypothetical protein